MAGIGEASAILGVAQIGLQLAQTLVTVIGDYRDAAININRLRDEIHLTSICLQQLGDLAKQDRLLAGRGVLEATNLRERCRSVIWEIRSTVKKGDDPLQPEEITKDQIDVTYFMSWKWALWTKKHLEQPRQELDRLKDSMTLTFVSQMALTAATEREKAIYIAQIPGMRRNVDWAEQRFRQGEDNNATDVIVPKEVLEFGPEVWQEFIKYMESHTRIPTMPEPETSDSEPKSQSDFMWLREHLESAGIPNEQITTVLQGLDPTRKDALAPNQIRNDSERLPNGEKPVPEVQAWSLDPFTGRIRMPVTDQWVQQELKDLKQSPKKLWQLHSKLHAWYKTQLDELLRTLNSETGLEWTLSALKLIRRKSLFMRSYMAPTLQVILKQDMTKMSENIPVTTFDHIEPVHFDEIRMENSQIQNKTGVTYSVPIDTEVGMSLENEARYSEQIPVTDEQIIQKQLALYTDTQENPEGY